MNQVAADGFVKSTGLPSPFHHVDTSGAPPGVARTKYPAAAAASYVDARPRFCPPIPSSFDRTFTNGVSQTTTFIPLPRRNAIIYSGDAKPGYATPSYVPPFPNCVMFHAKSLYATSHGESNTNTDTGILFSSILVTT